MYTEKHTDYSRWPSRMYIQCWHKLIAPVYKAFPLDSCSSGLLQLLLLLLLRIKRMRIRIKKQQRHSDCIYLSMNSRLWWWWWWCVCVCGGVVCMWLTSFLLFINRRTSDVYRKWHLCELLVFLGPLCVFSLFLSPPLHHHHLFFKHCSLLYSLRPPSTSYSHLLFFPVVSDTDLFCLWCV